MSLQFSSFFSTPEGISTKSWVLPSNNNYDCSPPTITSPCQNIQNNSINSIAVPLLVLYNLQSMVIPSSSNVLTYSSPDNTIDTNASPFFSSKSLVLYESTSSTIRSNTFQTQTSNFTYRLQSIPETSVPVLTISRSLFSFAIKVWNPSLCGVPLTVYSNGFAPFLYQSPSLSLSSIWNPLQVNPSSFFTPTTFIEVVSCTYSGSSNNYQISCPIVLPASVQVENWITIPFGDSYWIISAISRQTNSTILTVTPPFPSAPTIGLESLFQGTIYISSNEALTYQVSEYWWRNINVYVQKGGYGDPAEWNAIHISYWKKGSSTPFPPKPSPAFLITLKTNSKQ